MYVIADKGQLRKVDDGFPVGHLDVNRLLANWRWLCPAKMRLIARNAFGDLFLSGEDGKVHWLDIGSGKLSQLTNSEEHFRACLREKEFREHWFAEQDERESALRGLIPGADQCIAFALPLVFKEAGPGNKAYIVDIYECVSFLGNLHHQLAGVADGEKVRLVVKPKHT
jgi:hypothetical protein